jgi:hypothetical protein
MWVKASQAIGLRKWRRGGWTQEAPYLADMITSAASVRPQHRLSASPLADVSGNNDIWKGMYFSVKNLMKLAASR